MRDIRDNTVIQIEVTNRCHLSCRHCTRHVGLHAKTFDMSLDDIKRAIDCTLDSPCRIGIMGGEPVVHPEFEAICRIVQERIPLERREFWTAGFRWNRYEALIKETFARINFNNHIAYDGRHTPLLVALDEVVDDPELRAELIDSCPFQARWSASITPKGGFFCEIAASMDWLFDGPGGWPIEPGWWKRGVADYASQIEASCGKCGGCIPMPKQWTDARGGRDKPVYETMTAGNRDRLMALGSPKVTAGLVDIWTRKIDRAWVDEHRAINPREYRSFEAFSPEDVRKALDKPLETV